MDCKVKGDGGWKIPGISEFSLKKKTAKVVPRILVISYRFSRQAALILYTLKDIDIS
jgi:hypothetical protein